MNFPKVSVIIVSYNAEKYLNACIDSMLNMDYPKDKLEIVVADNGSKDKSVEIIKDYGKKIKFVNVGWNAGFTGGTNAAYKLCSGEYILFFNVDAYAPKELLKNMLNTFNAKENIAVVGAFDYAPGTALEKMKPSGAQTMNLTGSNTNELIRNFGSAYVKGAGLLVNTKYIPDKGTLLDEDYFLYYDDNYVGLLFNFMGLKAVYSPESKFWHYGSAISGKASKTMVYWSERNRLMLIRTFYRLKSLVKLSPVIALDMLVRIFNYTFVNPSNFTSFVKALWWNIINTGLIWKKRNALSKIKKVRDEDVFKLMSYKLFPKHENLLVTFLNFFVRVYLKMIGIKTAEDMQ